MSELSIDAQIKIIRSQAEKTIRTEAKKVGLLFKRTNSKLNGAYLWCFEDRENGRIVFDYCQFWTAYESVCSGFIASYNKDLGCFEG
ncbi:hypothetical protein [Aliikangiella maris]|uniref:Uncharacterized protein n=2 Tax=Aliikangiella maris TaxID=3162458 RepID=A0ABV2BYU5_9GAMM